MFSVPEMTCNVQWTIVLVDIKFYTSPLVHCTESAAQLNLPFYLNGLETQCYWFPDCLRIFFRVRIIDLFACYGETKAYNELKP